MRHFQRVILISIRPEHLVKILTGEKTLEIRKNMPKCDYPVDVYIYCTQDLNALLRFVDNRYMFLSCSSMSRKQELESGKYLNGKVVARFTLNRVEEIDKFSPSKIDLKGSCVSYNEYMKYIGEKHGYVWHIDNLVILDKPLLLYEDFYKVPKKGDALVQTLLRAPQSWQYALLGTGEARE